MFTAEGRAELGRQNLEKIRTKQDHDNPMSNNIVNDEAIDYEAWTEFISYYRYYIDEFATDILGLKLFPFQRVILRAMARYDSSMLIACRGLGKNCRLNSTLQKN